ncbi:MAG: sulfatase-like hydrolase/transferase [Phycisphaerae bacterium]|nr:sulfatase-like hydrolase/transferase [Phycisphaerae bacterium]
MRLNRRTFLRTAGCSTFALALAGNNDNASSARDRKERPNFIFILTDDQRHDAMGCAGNPLIHTPNIDSLAARGVRFEKAFVTLSICSPSRAACLTGRYGSANGVTSVPGTLNKGEKTICHYLKDAGYRTGMVGKWHLGNSPAECGFDFAEFFESNGTYYNRKVLKDGKRITTKGYIEDYNAQKAIEFIEQGSSPFMLWLCTQVPHMDHTFDWPARKETLAKYDVSKICVPETWQDDLKGKPAYLAQDRNRKQALRYGYDKQENIRRHFQRYYAAITEMDAALGRVLDAVGRLGLRNNTYILFMGDNGWFMGGHGFTSKVLPYEESIRVPMIVAGPGIGRRVDSNLVLNIDLAPTILELAQIDIPKNVHGSSLVPLFKGQKVNWRQSFLYEAPTPSLGSRPLLAVRTHRYKFVQTFDVDEPTKVVFEELYDLERDPKEMKNLAGEAGCAETTRQLRAELERAKNTIRP